MLRTNSTSRLKGQVDNSHPPYTMRLNLFVPAVTCALYLCCGTSYSQVTQKSKVPSKFDRAIVTTLIGNLDSEQDATQLKLGYLIHQRPSDWPITDALTLMDETLKKVPVNSDKWFWLQSVEAFGLMRVDDKSREQALVHYETTFAHADQATSLNKQIALTKSISDYCRSISRYYGDLETFDDNATISRVGTKAWEAYMKVCAVSPGYVVQPVEWQNVFPKISPLSSIYQSTERILASLENRPKTYGVLLAAATAYLFTTPPNQKNRALELLKQAEPLIPSDNPDELLRFTRYYIAASSNNPNYLPEAIERQKQVVAKTNRGRLYLLSLYRDAAGSNSNPTQNEDIAAIWAGLSTESVPESEILDVVKHSFSEFNLHPEDKGLATKILEVTNYYLNQPRKRSLEEELAARLMTAHLYMELDQKENAKKVLETIPQVTSTETRLVSARRMAVRDLLSQMRK